MKYSKIPEHWKYRLRKQHTMWLQPPGDTMFTTDFVWLDRSNIGDYLLSIKAGYAWNGANVIPDSPDVMIASLVHDCFYQMIAQGHLGMKYKQYADDLFKQIYLSEAIRLAPKNKHGKVSKFRIWSIQSYAKTIHWAVSKFGGRSLKKKNYPEEEVIAI